jgi:hypothetical protein
MPVLEPKIKKGDYVVAIIRNTDGQISDGVVKFINSRTVVVQTPSGDDICDRKYAMISEISHGNLPFVQQARMKLKHAS